MKLEFHHHHQHGEFEWLELDFHGSAQAPADGLRVEVGSRDSLIRCGLGGSTRIWARVDRYLQGMTVLNAPASESPGILPPWSFGEVREEGGSDAVWARRVADDLVASPRSPLSRGTFGIARTSADRLGRHVAHRECNLEPAWGLDDPEVFPRSRMPERFNWEGSFGVVFALRTCPDEEEGRLKAWRKAAREGWIPPLVLFWVSGLNAWVLIDGHLRLRAAQLENVAPRVLLVWRLIEEVSVNEVWTAMLSRRYEYAGKRWSEIGPELRVDLNAQLVDSYVAVRHRPRSAATVRSDLRALFEREAQHLSASEKGDFIASVDDK